MRGASKDEGMLKLSTGLLEEDKKKGFISSRNSYSIISMEKVRNGKLTEVVWDILVTRPERSISGR